MEYLSYESKLLASYSTYKALFDCHMSAYDIVAEFLNDAIRDIEGSFYYSQELKKLIRDKFGLDIPSVVIDTAAKKIKCLKRQIPVPVTVNKL